MSGAARMTWCSLAGAALADALAQRRGQRAVAHAVGKDVHARRAGAGGQAVEEFTEIVRRPLDVGLVERVARGRALRRPAVNHDQARELEVVLELRRAEQRGVEVVEVAVYVHQHVVRFRPGSGGGTRAREPGRAQGVEALNREVLVGVELLPWCPRRIFPDQYRSQIRHRDRGHPIGHRPAALAEQQTLLTSSASGDERSVA